MDVLSRLLSSSGESSNTCLQNVHSEHLYPPWRSGDLPLTDICIRCRLTEGCARTLHATDIVVTQLLQNPAITSCVPDLFCLLLLAIQVMNIKKKKKWCWWLDKINTSITRNVISNNFVDGDSGGRLAHCHVAVVWVDIWWVWWCLDRHQEPLIALTSRWVNKKHPGNETQRSTVFLQVVSCCWFCVFLRQTHFSWTNRWMDECWGFILLSLALTPQFQTCQVTILIMCLYIL